jgi:hypothetical protein
MHGAGGRKVKHFHELSEDDEVNKAELTIKFDSDTKYKVNEEGDIQYLFSNIEPKSEEELKKLETEAFMDYLAHKGTTLLSKINDQNDMKVKMVLNNEKINLVIESKEGKSPRGVGSKNITIKGDFFIKEAITLKMVKKISSPKPIKPYWTKTKIIFSILVVIILFLTFFFRKKI